MTKLQVAQTQGLHTQIYLNNEIDQIKQHQQMGTQIRSRLPPFSSINGPSPLAPINENTTQTKSLIPPDISIQSLSYQKSLIATKYSSFISFFSDLWNSPTSVPDPTVYL